VSSTCQIPPTKFSNKHVIAASHESVIGTKRTSSNVRCLVANGGKADIVERRGDLKEMGTGMEPASPAEGTSDLQSDV
jgi:hypothetical protein